MKKLVFLLAILTSAADAQVANGYVVITGTSGLSSTSTSIQIDPTQGNFDWAANHGILCGSTGFAAANTTALIALNNTTVRFPDNATCYFNTTTLSGNTNLHILLGKKTVLAEAANQHAFIFKFLNTVNSGISGFGGPDGSSIDLNANNYGSFGSQSLSSYGITVTGAGTGYPALRYIGITLTGGGCTGAPTGYVQIDSSGTGAWTGSTGTTTRWVITDPGEGCDGVTAFSAVNPFQGTWNGYPAVPTNQSAYTVVVPTFSFGGSQTIYNNASSASSFALFGIQVSGATGFFFRDVTVTSSGSSQANMSAFMNGMYIFNSDFVVERVNISKDGTLSGKTGILIDPNGSSTNSCVVRNSEVDNFGNNIHISNSNSSASYVPCTITDVRADNAFDWIHGVGPYGNALSVFQAQGIKVNGMTSNNAMLSCIRNAGSSGNPDTVAQATQYNLFTNGTCQGAGETSIFLGDLGAQLSTVSGYTISNFQNGVVAGNLTNRPTGAANYIQDNTFSNGRGFGILGSHDEVRRNHLTDVSIGHLMGLGGSASSLHIDEEDCHDSAFNPNYSMGACFYVDKLLTSTAGQQYSLWMGPGNTMDSSFIVEGTLTSGSTTVASLKNLSGTSYAAALPQSVVGLPVVGVGIPNPTYIVSVSSGAMVISNAANVSGSNVNITINGQVPFQITTDTGYLSSNPSLAVVGVTGSNGNPPVVYVTGTPPTAGTVIIIEGVQGTSQINGVYCTVGTVTAATGSGSTLVPANFPCSNLTWQSWGTYTASIVPDVFGGWSPACSSSTTSLNSCIPPYANVTQVGFSNLGNATAQPSAGVVRVLASGNTQVSVSADILNHEMLSAGAGTVGSTTLSPSYLMVGSSFRVHAEGIYTTSASTTGYFDLLLGGNSLVGTAAGSVITAVPGSTAGVGCTANDTLNVPTGTGGVVKILTVASGVPLTYSIVQGGHGYTAQANAITTAVSSTCSTLPGIATTVGGVSVTFGAAANSGQWKLDYIGTCKAIAAAGCTFASSGSFDYTTGNNTAWAGVALNNSGNSVTGIVPTVSSLISFPFHFADANWTLKVNEFKIYSQPN